MRRMSIILFLILMPSLGLFASKSAAEDVKVFRGQILHFLSDPSKTPSREQSYEYIEDGALVIKDGMILEAGDAKVVLQHYPKAALTLVQGLIVPGFIDTHIHYPQTEMVAAYGEELLQWLEKYTFPTERQYQDKAYAVEAAEVFIKELMRAGTTTALVFSTVHKESVDALMESAARRNMRLITGKVLMDRNAPTYLSDTADSAYADSKYLINKWHHKGRLLYAVTPRFAPTSSAAQLRVAERLLAECSDCYLHTHVAENKAEVAWVQELFAAEVPPGTTYLGVYNYFGLLTKRSLLAHGIHLGDADFDLLRRKESAIAFCPTSNLFLGSGLFDFEKARRFDLKLGLGTDIGAGTSFSQLQSLNEAYKVVKLKGGKLSAWDGFYLATLGSARALDLDGKIGNFEPGKEADFVILDWQATPLLSYRMVKAKTLEEKLFVLMTLGDDRAVAATYVAGQLVHQRLF